MDKDLYNLIGVIFAALVGWWSSRFTAKEQRKTSSENSLDARVQKLEDRVDKLEQENHLLIQENEGKQQIINTFALHTEQVSYWISSGMNGPQPLLPTRLHEFVDPMWWTASKPSNPEIPHA